MTRENIENNVGYWQEKANLEYIRQRQERGVNDPYMITEIDEAFDAGFDKGYQYALQHHQWIPIKKEQPKVSGDYIICEKRGFVKEAHYFEFDDLWMLPGGALVSPTHWMQMPQSPRKEE